MGYRRPGAAEHRGKKGELPWAVVLCKSRRLVNGFMQSGNLVATAQGLQLHQQGGTFLSGGRYYRRSDLVRFSDVLGYELTGEEASVAKATTRTRGASRVAFTPINATHSHSTSRTTVKTPGTSVLVLFLPGDQFVINIPMPPSTVRRLLGKQLAGIDARQRGYPAPAPFAAPFMPPTPAPSLPPAGWGASQSLPPPPPVWPPAPPVQQQVGRQPPPGWHLSAEGEPGIWVPRSALQPDNKRSTNRQQKAR